MTINIKGYQCKLTFNNSKILNSYKIKNEDISTIVETIIQERTKLNYPIYRKNKKYISEIKAHNRLYKLHIARKHTIDTDLEEPIIWYYQLFFDILGI